MSWLALGSWRRKPGRKRSISFHRPWGSFTTRHEMLKWTVQRPRSAFPAADVRATEATTPRRPPASTGCAGCEEDLAAGSCDQGVAGPRGDGRACRAVGGGEDARDFVEAPRIPAAFRNVEDELTDSPHRSLGELLPWRTSLPEFFAISDHSGLPYLWTDIQKKRTIRPCKIFDVSFLWFYSLFFLSLTNFLIRTLKSRINCVIILCARIEINCIRCLKDPEILQFGSLIKNHWLRFFLNIRLCILSGYICRVSYLRHRKNVSMMKAIIIKSCYDKLGPIPELNFSHRNFVKFLIDPVLT